VRERERQREREGGLNSACILENAIFVVDGDRIGDGDGSIGGKLGRERLKLLQRSLESNLLGLIQR